LILLDEQVVFLPGLSKDTLPTLGDARFALIRLDGDMYESTMDALTNLYDRVPPPASSSSTTTAACRTAGAPCTTFWTRARSRRRSSRSTRARCGGARRGRGAGCLCRRLPGFLPLSGKPISPRVRPI
jgi:hypothetical protein